MRHLYGMMNNLKVSAEDILGIESARKPLDSRAQPQISLRSLQHSQTSS